MKEARPLSETAAKPEPSADNLSSRVERERSGSHGVMADGQTGVFIFWAYFVGLVSLTTLAVFLASSMLSNDEKTEFYSLPDEVRLHFTKGKFIKIEAGPDRQPIKVFIREAGPQDGECVFLIHGLGSSSFLYRDVILHAASQGMRVVAADLPGSGLSDKTSLVLIEEHNFFSRLGEIWDEIAEKGLLWRFEQLFETGELPDHVGGKQRTERRVLSLDAENLGDSLGQVVDSLLIPAVHLVLHDTGLEAGIAWAVHNPTRVRSITFIDTVPHRPMFPLWILGIPGIRFLGTRSTFLHWLLLRVCCARNLPLTAAEAHSFLLRRDGGCEATKRTWSQMNLSSNLAGTLEDISDVPLQLVWASSWGKNWEEEGKLLAARLPRATFSNHHGSRWPQEDAATEIANTIQHFISSLPPTPRVNPAHEHAHMLDEPARMVDTGYNRHHSSPHEHDADSHHNHDFGLAYTDGNDHGGWFM